MSFSIVDYKNLLGLYKGAACSSPLSREVQEMLSTQNGSRNQVLGIAERVVKVVIQTGEKVFFQDQEMKKAFSENPSIERKIAVLECNKTLELLDEWVKKDQETRNTAAQRIREFIQSPDQSRLDLTGLQLTSLPSIFDSMQFHNRLQYLSISGNLFTSNPFPAGMERCIPQEERNFLVAPPPAVSNHPVAQRTANRQSNLDIIRIAHRTTEWPRWENNGKQSERRVVAQERIRAFLQSPDQSKLDLTGLGLTSLPLSFFDSMELRNRLKVLDISNNPLENSSFLEQIENCTQLEALIARNCQLCEFPKGLLKCTMLEKLDFSENPLGRGGKSLPGSITKLDQLKTLSVHNCQFTWLPSQLAQCAMLEKLDISENPLGRIPLEIGNLTRLIKLNVSNCQLVYFPRVLGNLTSLNTLDISENPFGRASLPEELEIWLG